MGKRYFLPITWLNLRRSAVKVRKWIGKLGLAITFAARRHNVNVLLRNSTFLIFAVLVVWCRPCRR